MNIFIIILIIVICIGCIMYLIIKKTKQQYSVISNNKIIKDDFNNKFNEYENRLLNVDNRLYPLVEQMCLERINTQYNKNNLLVLQSSINVPLLLLSSIWLTRLCRKKKIDTLLMATRDCCLLRKLMKKFWDGNLVKFYTSRKCLTKKSKGYMDYVKHNIKENTMYIDIRSLGQTPYSFFNPLNIPVCILFLSKNKQLQQYIDHITFNIPDIILEPLNHDIEATTIDVINNKPIFANYDGNIMNTKLAHDAFWQFIEKLEIPNNHVINILKNLDLSNTIIKELCKVILEESLQYTKKYETFIGNIGFH